MNEYDGELWNWAPLPEDTELACAADYCDLPGPLYVFGTTGESARCTIVTGVRAKQLGRMTPENVRCIEHACHEIEAMYALAVTLSQP